METSCEYMDKVPVPWTQAGYGVSGWLPDICISKERHWFERFETADRRREVVCMAVNRYGARGKNAAGAFPRWMCPEVHIRKIAGYSRAGPGVEI